MKSFKQITEGTNQDDASAAIVQRVIDAVENKQTTSFSVSAKQGASLIRFMDSIQHGWHRHPPKSGGKSQKFMHHAYSTAFPDGQAEIEIALFDKPINKSHTCEIEIYWFNKQVNEAASEMFNRVMRRLAANVHYDWWGLTDEEARDLVASLRGYMTYLGADVKTSRMGGELGDAIKRLHKALGKTLPKGPSFTEHTFVSKNGKMQVVISVGLAHDDDQSTLIIKKIE